MDITADLPKLDHPKFDHYATVAGHAIACFRFGYYEQPPAEVKAAQTRILNALSAMNTDVELMRQWGGRVHVEAINSRSVNPVVTDADIEACEQAVRIAIRDAIVVQSWRNLAQGLHGVSVKFRLP